MQIGNTYRFITVFKLSTAEDLLCVHIPRLFVIFYGCSGHLFVTIMTVS